MRRSAPFCLLALLAAAPAAAQGFEGTVTAKMPVMGDGGDVKYLIKGDKSAALVTMGANAGPMGGKEMRIITDGGTMTSTILIPMQMGDSKGMKMVTDLSKAAAANKTPVDVKALGTSETIAGYKCDNYEATEGKNVTRMCISSGLGMFSMPSGGPMGRGGGGSSGGWTTVFAKHPGFPLRVSDGAGKVMIEVTSIQKGSVPSSEFTVPDGYMDMSGMAGMGRRGGGGGR